MRRLLTAVTALALLVPIGAAAEPTRDAEGIERIDGVEYGDPTASGTTPFFASGTDIDFAGRYVYAAEQADQGNTDGGVHIIDVFDPDNPVKVGFIDCPAYQNDVAVVEDGIIALAYHAETGNTCRGLAGTPGTAGVRLYQVTPSTSDAEHGTPVEVTPLGVSPQLPGGTHTITVHPSGDYIYASPGGIANGGGTQQIIDVSDRNPDGRFPVATYQPNAAGCHDFSFFTSVDDRELGVCVGLTESQIWDVSDPMAPETIAHIVNPLIFFHHTGIVSDDGRYLVIGDEAFGAHDCAGGPTGAMFLYDLSVPEAPVPLSYFGIDRAHDDAAYSTDRTDWCTAHLYNFIPGTMIMVASWYSGGINIIDWSDPTAPREIAHYRMDGEYAASEVSNYWSAYWHDGRIYANDRVRGFEALRWTDFDEAFPDGTDDPEAISAFAASLRGTARGGWHHGRLFDTPTPEQALHLMSRPALDSVTAGLSPYSCRLVLVD